MMLTSSTRTACHALRPSFAIRSRESNVSRPPGLQRSANHFLKILRDAALLQATVITDDRIDIKLQEFPNRLHGRLHVRYRVLNRPSKETFPKAIFTQKELLLSMPTEEAPRYSFDLFSMGFLLFFSHWIARLNGIMTFFSLLLLEVFLALKADFRQKERPDKGQNSEDQTQFK